MFLKEMTQYLGRWNPVDVKEIEPLVVAYQPTHLQQVPQQYQELLRADPDPAREQALPSQENTAKEDGWSEWVILDSKNPEKVAHNLRVLQRAFEQALPSHAKTAGDHGLSGWRELLLLNVRHLTEGESCATQQPNH